MFPIASRVRIFGLLRGLAFGALLAAGLAFHPLMRAQITVTGFGPGSWGAADTNFGVDGFTIEDFEDTTLIPGVLVGWISTNGNVTPTSTIPAAFQPATDDGFGTVFNLGPWDGTKGLINTRTNDSFAYTGASDDWGNIRIEFTTGASSVGFSLEQMDVAGNLVVNGSSLGLITTLSGLSTAAGRQGYIRIDGNGTTITSLELQNSGGDGFLIDHLAVAAIPEPAIHGMAAGLAALALAIDRGRRRTRAG